MENSNTPSFNSNDLVVLLSYGQSLSVGYGPKNTVISNNSPYSQTVLDLKNGQLVDKISENYESHLPGMMNRIAHNFQLNGMDAPKLLGLSAGISSATIQELYIDFSDRFGNLQDGLSNTNNLDIFYIQDRYGRPDIYMNNNGQAIPLERKTNAFFGEGAYFEGIKNKLIQAKVAAAASGLEVHNELFFTFVHGQSNNDKYVGVLEYEEMLEKLIKKIDAYADAIFGKNIDVITTITQTRGYGSKSVSSEQFDYVVKTKNSYLGALEFQYQAQQPYALDPETGEIRSNDITHLNSAGYNMMGQALGDTVFGAITKTLNEDHIIRIDKVTVNDNKIVLTFEGLGGHLVYDPSIFSSLVGKAPAHYGFFLFHEDGGTYKPGLVLPKIIASEITGLKEITLTLNGKINGTYNLSVGRTKYKEDGSTYDYGGSSLRDSEASSMNNFDAWKGLNNSHIKKYIPTQHVWIDNSGLIKTQFADDVFIGSPASEIFDGNTGFDTVDYSQGDAVRIDLANSKNSLGYAEGDALRSIENIIGSNSSDRAQRDWIWGDSNRNVIKGMAGNDILEGGAGADIIDGGADWDYSRYIRSDAAVNVNLETGINTGGHAQGDILIGIEAVVGSSYDDVITGGKSNDYLKGENGNDYLSGGIGHDQLFGGLGDDTYYYNLGKDSITEQGNGIDRVIFDKMWKPEHAKVSGNTIIFNDNVNYIKFADISLIEFFNFHRFGDLTLQKLIDFVPPNPGDDLFMGDSRVKIYDGGEGYDTVDYSAAKLSIKIDLQDSIGLEGDALNDVFISIENITGSNDVLSRDYIWGDNNNNLLKGMAGNDILEGGAGADIIDGGAGWDYSRYTRSDAAININLETGINTGGHAQGDTLIGIEAVVGSNYDDVIIGGSNNDYISAAKGNDILNGGLGNDTLLGGAGNDILSGDGGSDKLYGESGADIFLFEASAFNGIDTIYDFSTAQGDQLSIVGLLQGYDPLQNAIDDFVNFTTVGANTTFTVDRDGTEAIYSSQTIATLNAITGLDADSLLASGNLLVV